MSFKFDVNFENDSLQAKAKNCRSEQKEKSLCHEFKIADVTDQNTITATTSGYYRGTAASFNNRCQIVKIIPCRVLMHM